MSRSYVDPNETNTKVLPRSCSDMRQIGTTIAGALHEALPVDEIGPMIGVHVESSMVATALG